MPKKIKVKYDDVLTIDKLYNAFYRCRKGRANKKEIVKFELNLGTNIVKLYDELSNITYKPSFYKSFIIYEPKERLIKTLPLKDRIVHQWFVEEILKPYMVPRFIEDSFACIKERGTHSAYKKILFYMRYMRRMYGKYYIVKCDIKKYFFNINRKKLYEIIYRKYKDKKILELTKVILGDFEEKGIPIGNYTSQYFANIYLNELDYFVKFDLKIKCYARYMDDLVLLVKNKEEAKYVFFKIKQFLKETLDLELNDKSNYYPSFKGCDFCGFIIHEDFLLLRKRNKNSIKSNIKRWNFLYKIGKLDMESFYKSMASYKGHVMHADSYKFMEKYLEKIEFDY